MFESMCIIILPLRSLCKTQANPKTKIKDLMTILAVLLGVQLLKIIPGTRPQPRGDGDGGGGGGADFSQETSRHCKY